MQKFLGKTGRRRIGFKTDKFNFHSHYPFSDNIGNIHNNIHRSHNMESGTPSRVGATKHET